MWLSVREAARVLGVSPQTVRRRIKRGDLSSQRIPRPQGFTYQVDVPDEVIDQVPPARDATGDQVTSLSEALSYIRELQQKNEELAVLVGTFRERSETLGKLLGAPKRRPWWRRLFRRGE